MGTWKTLGGVLFLIAMVSAGCGNKARSGGSASSAKATCATPAAAGQQAGKHKAVHGGSLNAIVTCENGHAEVKLEGDTLHVWFVSGGSATDQSVRIPDRSVRLQVQTKGGEKTLVLNPTPLELAGEKIGDCSSFEGAAPWLKGLASFTARGKITFRGQSEPVRIEYPQGYDPD